MYWCLSGWSLVSLTHTFTLMSHERYYVWNHPKFVSLFNILFRSSTSCSGQNERRHQSSAWLTLSWESTGYSLYFTHTWWRHQMETFSALLAFCAENHRSPVTSPHKGLWRGALMFSLICVWINSWVNNPEARDLRRHRAHCDVSVMRKPVMRKTLQWHRFNSSLPGQKWPPFRRRYFQPYFLEWKVLYFD